MTERGKPKSGCQAQEEKLREVALAYPEAYEEFPWGHRAIKVNKKIFVTLACDEDGLHMSLKLTDSNEEALLLPFTEPTHYGMGKYGWVTSHFAPGDSPPLAILCGWIDESYRAIAPKRLVAELDGAPPPKKTTKKKTARKKAARKATKRKAR